MTDPQSTTAERFRLAHRAWKLAGIAYDKAFDRVEHFAQTSRPWDPVLKRFVIPQEEIDADTQLKAARTALNEAFDVMRAVALELATETLNPEER